MTEVLFIYHHNACRSPLGAALVEHLAADRYTARSAGPSPAEAVNPAIISTVSPLRESVAKQIEHELTGAR